MKNYGSRNSLDPNTLYNSQIGSMMFLCGIVFKLSSLPGMVAKVMHSSTIWIYLIMTSIELFGLIFIYLFMRFKGDEFLTTANSKAYKLILFIVMLYLSIKGLIYFAYTAIFLSNELFLGVAPYIVLIAFFLPIVYIGVKGVRTIARCSEVLFLLLFAGIVLNLVFLKTDLDFGRNLPILSMSPKEFFSDGLRYGLWLGDMMPLLFIKMRAKKLPYIGIFGTLTYLLVIIIPLIGVAMYGDAMGSVSNMLLRISEFSELSLDIGRMEWVSLFVVLTMAMFTLSFIYWGITACSERIFGSKKPLQIGYPLFILITVVAVPSVKVLADVAFTALSYIMIFLSVLLPALLCILYAAHKKVKNHALFGNIAYNRVEQHIKTANAIACKLADGYHANCHLMADDSNKNCQFMSDDNCTNYKNMADDNCTNACENELTDKKSTYDSGDSLSLCSHTNCHSMEGDA